MSDKRPSIWMRLRSWFRDMLLTLAVRQWGEGWDLLPVYKGDEHGAWVSMNETAYRALILFGYAYPEDEQPDWSLEHDMEPAELLALIQDAVRTRVEVE